MYTLKIQRRKVNFTLPSTDVDMVRFASKRVSYASDDDDDFEEEEDSDEDYGKPKKKKASPAKKKSKGRGVRVAKSPRSKVTVIS